MKNLQLLLLSTLLCLSINVEVGNCGLLDPIVGLPPVLNNNHTSGGYITEGLKVPIASSVIDGTRTTNQGPVTGPTNTILPSIANARHYVHFAGAAYCERLLANWSCSWCDSDYNYLGSFHNAEYNTLVFFATNSARKEILVSYRGSTNAQNFGFDEVATLVPHREGDISGIKVHQGFQLMTLSLYPSLLEKLKNLTAQFPDYKIILTGHSLGSAQASLTVFWLFWDMEFPDTKIEFYGYGHPRVGNKAFADYFNALSIPSVRVNNRADIVPHAVPAPEAVLGYYHFQNELWIYSSDPVRGNWSEKYCSRNVYEDPSCSDSLGPVYSFPDHLNYYDVNILTCMQQDPFFTTLQFLVPLDPGSSGSGPQNVTYFIPYLPQYPQFGQFLNAIYNFSG